MPPHDADAPTAFPDLGLRPELLAPSTAPGLRGADARSSARRSRRCSTGRDLLGQAATGTGKTAAFALPMLQRLGRAAPAAPRPSALVLVPTRELAMQVVRGDPPLRPRARRPRAADLRRPADRPPAAAPWSAGVDVVVATPGRALDHIGRGTLRPRRLEVVVLDEADEMLDMGFAEDIEAILDATPDRPPDRAVLGHHAAAHRRASPGATCATRSGSRSAASRPPTGDGAAGPPDAPTSSPGPTSPPPWAACWTSRRPTAAIVFCRTRIEVDQLTETLNGRGYRAEALHGGMSQEQRDRVMDRLRGGTADLLVATDVAARGLDIDQLTHVVNYDVPSAPESYVHRIGRVGRPRALSVGLEAALVKSMPVLANGGPPLRDGKDIFGIEGSLHTVRGWVAAFDGDRKRALAEADSAVALFGPDDDSNDGPAFLRQRALIRIVAGEPAGAVDDLQRLLGMPGLTTVWELRLDPMYDLLRGRKDFQVLVGRE